MRTAILHLSILVLPTLVLAVEGPPLNPGQWTITSSTRNPNAEQATTKTREVCITEENSDPLKELVASDTCSITKRELQGSKLAFEFVCSPVNSKPSTGKGEYTGLGDSTEGWMELGVLVNDEPWVIKGSWEGKRTGDCPAEATDDEAAAAKN